MLNRFLGPVRDTALLLISVLGCLHPSIAAAQVQASIGEQSIVLPQPAAGYSAVPATDADLNRFVDSFVTPANRRLATFLTDSDLKDVLAGQLHAMPRRFSAETMRKLESESISAADFKRLQSIVHEQLLGEQTNIRERANAQMSTANGALTQANGAPTAITIKSLEVLPPHVQSERSLQLSMRSTYRRDIEGESDEFTVTASMALVQIGGKVIFLYVYGDERDLDWTRSALRDWVSAIETANPVPSATTSTVHASGVDWGRVVGKGIAGALIAGLLSLFGLFRKKASA